ncbi:phosphoethanolamine--lipid A transferase [Amphritea opalescens]|uniref:Phosphoethanolamine--lipid A transferase n=1 Tax=Amphritea opalescens TaxID=2490544 RepID=A0A430KRQ4_9GAMM|nr:phosphoethanolamine--lipid A transferase [Amphritea opalescens]RTE66191.1 phosphoethanolamine--lipid A transferase [Amphritea opalescens]
MPCAIERILEKLPKHCASWLMTLLVSTYLMLMFNANFFSTVYDIHGVNSIKDLLFMVGLFFFFIAIFNLFLTFLALPWVLKPVLITLLITSSVATYFMQTYNIMIDKTMIMNMMETDLKESTELFSISLLAYVTLTGVLPALWVWHIQINYGSPLRFLLTKVTTFTAIILVIGLIAVTFYQDYASLFRNHRYVRDLIVPLNYVYSLQSYAQHFLPKNKREFQTVGSDAHLGLSWQPKAQKKVVTILVVGETARRANFSLYDYERQTTPKLSQQNIFSFSDFSSCGTSTAVSLPCMFSNMDRSNYDHDQAINSDNLLDVLQRSGLSVIWEDNNSGCKGVCNRVENVSIVEDDNPALCHDGECFDMVLLEKLEQTIKAADNNVVIVLHQKGSHGPSYFLRAPEAFRKFSPVCDTNQLQECSQQEIINAYDNTVLYTDYFLSEVINFLKSRSDQYDASMLYLSDHGESLGENNLYLHGVPYMLAPKEQTEIPFIFWMDDGFANRFSINKHCIDGKRKDHFSHDNLFDSMLGLLDVQTKAYRQDMDIFSSCRSSNKTSTIAATSNQ